MFYNLLSSDYYKKKGKIYPKKGKILKNERKHSTSARVNIAKKELNFKAEPARTLLEF